MSQPHSVLCWDPACAELHYPQTAKVCGRCGAPLALADRYQAIKLLGQGGSGRTWLAIALPRQSADRPAKQVVVKQFSPAWLAQQADNCTGLEQLLTTVSTSAWRLPSSMQTTLQRWQPLDPDPQIPVWLDYFERAGYCYLIQTYLPGENLVTMMARGQQFSPIAMGHLLASLLPVLHRMHTHGIIHRDIKPANIIRRPAIAPDSPAAYALVDWSTATSGADREGTRGVVAESVGLGFEPAPIGSPEYAAPEQLRGFSSAASDLYSLGVTCIHLLTGVPPFALFDGSENRWLWRKFWHPEIATLTSDTRLEVLFTLLDRLITPDPSQRLASAATAIAALQAYQSRIGSMPQPSTPHTWHPMITLHGHQGLFAKVNAVAIASPTLLASASDDRTIRLWDLPTGQETAVLTGHANFVHAVAFDPQDSDILVSGSRDRTLKRWYLPKPCVTHTLTGHTQPILAVAFTPDGQQIVSGSADKTLKFWDSQTGALNRTLTGHRLAVTAIAMIPGAPPLIASASADATIKLWDLATGALVQTLTGHTAAIRAIAVSPNGTWLASGGEDRTIRLWNLVTQQERCLPGHSWPVAALQFMPDGKTLVSGSWDHSLKLWCVNTGQVLEQLTGHTDSVSSIAIAPAGYPIVSGSHDATLKIWRCDR